MQPVLLSKIASLAFFFFGSTLLGVALLTHYWISTSTIFGPVNEGLWSSCSQLGCVSRQPGLVYGIFVQGVLISGEAQGIVCTIAYIINLAFKGKYLKRMIKNATTLAFMSASFITIGMSVYTGKFTRNVPTEARGWSFYFGWTCIFFFLGGALTSLHVLLNNAEEESVECRRTQTT